MFSLSQAEVQSRIYRAQQVAQADSKDKEPLLRSCFDSSVDDLINQGYSLIRAESEIKRKRILLDCDKVFGERLQQNLRAASTVMPVTPVKNHGAYIHNRNFQPLHTDNAYTHKAPGIVLLVCIRPADKGGTSLLVHLNEIKSHFSIEAPHVLNLLSDPDAVTYHRGKEILQKAIFTQNASMHQMLSFTVFADRISFPSIEHKSAFSQLVDYIHTSTNQYRLQLEENDILLMDNQSVAHGREPFDGERMLHRIWYNYSLT